MHPLQYHGKYHGGAAVVPVTRPKEGLSRPGTKARRVQDAVLELLREHARQQYGLPTYTRLLFYELEGVGLAVKPSPDDDRRHRRRSLGWPPGEQDVIDAVAVLRKAGEIPWEWIIDGERPLVKYPHAPIIRDYMLDRLDEAAVNPWHPASPPLLLTESKNMAQALTPPLAPLVPVIGGLKGQAGEGWLRTEVAPELAGDRRVLYLGDLDRAGADIERNARGVLERCTGRELDWTRLALTEGQIRDLHVEPIWRVDGRDRQGRWAWELEALGQSGLIRLARREIEARLPEPLAGVLERQEAERREVRRLLEAGER
jgi:hypothetical protein